MSEIKKEKINLYYTLIILFCGSLYLFFMYLRNGLDFSLLLYLLLILFLLILPYLNYLDKWERNRDINRMKNEKPVQFNKQMILLSVFLIFIILFRIFITLKNNSFESVIKDYKSLIIIFSELIFVIGFFMGNFISLRKKGHKFFEKHNKICSLNELILIILFGIVTISLLTYIFLTT